jgi:hypothetical protein
MSRNLDLERGPALRAALRRDRTIYNRSLRGFDANVASPIQAQALANYAKRPIAEFP